MIKNTATKHVLVLLALCYIFFMWGNGILHLTNPDEVFYAQTAKEMVQRQTWSVPYLFGHPQFEKPIFTYWFLRLGYILFGVSSFGARFFPAFFAMLGVLAAYWLAFLGFGERKKAFICAVVLLSSGLYIGLARTVFTDMIFSVLVFLSLVFFYWGFERPKRKAAGLLLFFFFSGLAVLAKGPLGFIIPLFSIVLFLALKGRLKFLLCWPLAAGFALFLLVSVPWYMFIINRYGSTFIQEFFYNDHLRRIIEAEHRHNDTWYFYPMSMVACMFPWTFFVVIALAHFFKKLKNGAPQTIYLFLASIIAIVFVVFQMAHSKLVSYIFPLFPALAILTGDFIDTAIRSQKIRTLTILSFVSWFTILCIPIGLLVSSIIYSAYVPSKAPIYAFVLLYAVLLGLMLFMIKRRKFLVNMYFLAVQIFLLLFFVYLSHNNLDVYASSRSAAEYLLEHERVDNTILCSKFLARGVRFYTDKDVAVIDIGGSNFFSPHPVPYLNSEMKVREFLEKQPLTYGIVLKSALGDLRGLAGKGFRLEELKTIGDEHVVKISKI